MLYGIGVGSTAALSIFTPISTKFGIWGIVILRALMGMGVIFY